MGSFFHILKTGKTQHFPRNWCFVDTETKERYLNSRVKYQHLKLGVASYVRDAVPGKPARDTEWTFKTPGDFWMRLLSESEPDRRLVVLAYFMRFDFIILHGFRVLVNLGYSPTSLFMSGSAFIGCFKKDKHKILILDACNYFQGKLAAWGAMLGKPKLSVDFKTVSDSKLEIYCRRDMNILKDIWLQWRGFVEQNELGHFSPTVSSQALNAFKYKFMHTRIFIHANPDATDLERGSYYGGRTECFHIGIVPGGPFYKLDVNSMYPAVMRMLGVPVKLKHMLDHPDLKDVGRLLKKYAMVAEVHINTTRNCYPLHYKGRLIFPVGDFRTVLCGPELALAIRNHDLLGVYKVALYTRKIVFRDFVNTLYALRSKYKKDGNKIFEKMVKRLMNSLYGKFGQRNEVWEYLGRFPDKEDGMYNICIAGTGSLMQQRIIAGHVWNSIEKVESMHSFPAISGYITSAARVYLWKLLCGAGSENVFYMDTDSLVVNKTGLDNLASFIEPDTLGKLKVEETIKRLVIYAPKDYEVDGRATVKGVKAEARKLGQGRFEYWEWRGLLGAIAKGTTTRVYMEKRTKTLRRRYTKGKVHTSGSVSPVELPLD